jgi:hypothetical protein
MTSAARRSICPALVEQRVEQDQVRTGRRDLGQLGDHVARAAGHPARSMPSSPKYAYRSPWP